MMRKPLLQSFKHYAMPPKTQRDSLNALPAETTDVALPAVKQHGDVWWKIFV